MNAGFTRTVSIVATVMAAMLLGACGGGGGSATGPTPPATTGAPTATPPATTATTTGVWKGTIDSTTTGQSSPVIALTGANGQSVWMTTDGRVWSGEMPHSGASFNATFAGHMYDGTHFPDGTNHGTWSFMFDHLATTATDGRFTGSGDAGTFQMEMNPMWNRPASLGEVAGVYTRSTSTGYTMTMTVSSNGQMSASDSRGCVFGGTVSVPDATHNMYRVDATVSSCGALDGAYAGFGTLVDADAMRDWMTAMHPLEQGGHSHGGGMMGGGSPVMGHNTVPAGQRNLFMFSIWNDHDAIMDALAR